MSGSEFCEFNTDWSSKILIPDNQYLVATVMKTDVADQHYA